MHSPGNEPLAIEKEAQERRFEEEAEDAFHRQRLADHSSRQLSESGPVGAELELHGNAGDYTKDEVDAEDATPEATGALPFFAAGSERKRLEDNDEESQAHGELRKEIVKGDGKSKVQPMNYLGSQREPPALKAIAPAKITQWARENACAAIYAMCQISRFHVI